MNQASRILLLVLGTALVAGTGSAVAGEDEIHVCRDGNGNTVFQSYPCPEPTAKNVTAKAPVAPRSQASVSRRPSAPVTTRPAAPVRAQPRAAAPSRASVPVSTPSTTPSPTPSRSTTSPTARRTQSTWIRVPPAQAAPPLPRRRLGKQTFPTKLGGAAQPAKASFVSPERTWRTFLAAIESGNRTGAVACLTPEALETLDTDVESFPLEELRTMVGTFTRIEDEGDLGPFWSIYGVRVKQRPKWIFFEQTESGDWKIAGI